MNVNMFAKVKLPGLLPLVFVLSMIPNATVYAQATSTAGSSWVRYEGSSGPGVGKHIVFVTGDEEYRSEEGMPMLAKILAVHHGFTATVLFAVDDDTGEINPDNQTNIPGLEVLDDADFMVLFTRFRELPDEDMKHIIDFTNSGKPVIGLRTSTHPFDYSRDKESPYAKWTWRSESPAGGYGKHVFGETWVNHHGHHKFESTRGLINGTSANHPVLSGVVDVWGTTDVYGIRALPDDAEVLLYGAVLLGMEPDSPINYEKSLMPIAWTRDFVGETGNHSRVFATTMGASVDFENADLRRLLVNSIYWGLEMEDQMPDTTNVDLVGNYNPTFYGFGEYQKGMKASDFLLENR